MNDKKHTEVVEKIVDCSSMIKLTKLNSLLLFGLAFGNYVKLGMNEDELFDICLVVLK